MTDGAGRLTLVLDGTWDVAEGFSAAEVPDEFGHRVEVPALTHSATPEFEKIDEFRTPEYDVVEQLIGKPASGFEPEGVAGTAAHPREFFWYRTHFDAPAKQAQARLRVNKAQFGSEVRVNGVTVGSNESGFTSATYDISDSVRWSEENEVLIRIGANPNALPPGNTAIYDFEKTHWTPGIYDTVSVYFYDGVSIVSTQVAPKLDPRQITVQTVLRNTSSDSVAFTLTQDVRAWESTEVFAQATQDVELGPGEERTVTEEIPLADAKLWTPESPNLYQVTTATDGDTVTTRFGMREFRFDTPTNRAYLNGKLIFLRGGNICLHRFFDDENSGTLPWQDDWVRELLGPKRRRMNWNTVKFTIGPVPERWLEIADEEGVLVFNEFPLWTLYPEITNGYQKELDVLALRREYEAWLSDSWNHPSVVYWAASLESKLPAEQSSAIIEEVRVLDRSDRPWGNSWNFPHGPNDPHEYKAYLSNDPAFDMMELEWGSGALIRPFDPVTAHTALITEFDWLWLNRDGTPTPYTTGLWERMPYPSKTPEERFHTLAYLLGGQVEYWRAHRKFAGILYLSYLSMGWVIDNFRDVKELEFQPHFEDFVGNAFKTVGVYVNFWQRQIEAGTSRTFDVMMINDSSEPAEGTLTLELTNAEGKVIAAAASRDFALTGYGQMTYGMPLDVPESTGKVTLAARAALRSGPSVDSTLSRRFFEVVPAGKLDPRHSSSGPVFVSKSD